MLVHVDPIYCPIDLIPRPWLDLIVKARERLVALVLAILPRPALAISVASDVHALDVSAVFDFAETVLTGVIAIALKSQVEG